MPKLELEGNVHVLIKSCFHGLNNYENVIAIHFNFYANNFTLINESLVAFRIFLVSINKMNDFYLSLHAEKKNI